MQLGKCLARIQNQGMRLAFQLVVVAVLGSGLSDDPPERPRSLF